MSNDQLQQIKEKLLNAETILQFLSDPAALHHQDGDHIRARLSQCALEDVQDALEDLPEA